MRNLVFSYEVLARHACVIIDGLFVSNPAFVEVFISNPDRHQYERKTDHALLIKVAP
jgi:hypothetical protein